MSLVFEVKPPAQPIHVQRAITGMDAVIAVYVPTRGRYKSCLSVLNSWRDVCEKPDKVKFLVGVDHDDKESQKIADDYPIHIFDESVITCGGRVKALAGAMEADIYLAIVDYYFCQTYQWDRILRHKMLTNEIINMACMHDINSFNLTAVTKKWHTLANPIEPELFPFWFSDQWRNEMHSFTFNRAATFTDEIKTAGNHGKTHNLHDLDYWWGLFEALRPLRIAQAHEIAKAYGVAPDDLITFTESRNEQINIFSSLCKEIRKGLAINEQRFGGGVKSEKYLKAKAIADAYIKEHDLKLWG